MIAQIFIGISVPINKDKHSPREYDRQGPEMGIIPAYSPEINPEAQREQDAAIRRGLLHDLDQGKIPEIKMPERTPYLN